MSKAKENNRAARGEEFPRPAFSSNGQAFGFLALVIFALLLPALISESGKISRRDSYDLMPENQGAYSFVKTEIFDEKADIDILFIGSSLIWNAVDAPQVQMELSSRLGRQARVVTFGNYFNSIDIPYTEIRDLLRQKRVRLIVFSVPRMPFADAPSATAYRFLRYDEDPEIFERLPLRHKLALYACGILRSPQDLLTMARKNLSKASPYGKFSGANPANLAMGRNPEKFVKFAPAAPSLPASEIIYSEETREKFEFTGENISNYQNIYFEKMLETLAANDVPLALINVPQYSERGSRKIIERKNFSEVFGRQIPLAGIAPAILYAGLSEDEIELLHYDDEHLNANGSEFYTRAMMPAILEIYEKHAAKNF